MHKFLSLFAVSFFLLPQAQAFLTIGESGEVVPANHYQVGAEPQLLLNRGGGFNFNGFIDANINDSTSARWVLGGGAVDFSTMASIKFVPFPDVDNQPAIGIRVGIGYARDEDQNLLFGQVAPLVSKKTTTDIGLLIPYVAIPLELVNAKSENYSSSRFVFGSEYIHPDLKEVRFGGELGIELNKSYSYLSVYVTLPFDSSKGFFK